MKFQDNYNMQIENMEDFILISYGDYLGIRQFDF